MLALAGVPVTSVRPLCLPKEQAVRRRDQPPCLWRFPYLERALCRIADPCRLPALARGPEVNRLVESPEPAALMIRRVEFDALLVSLAVEAGAELVTGVDVVQASIGGDGRRAHRARRPALRGADRRRRGRRAQRGRRRLGLNRGWPASSVALDMMEETPRAALRDIDPSTMWVAYGYDPEKLPKAQADGRSPRTRATARHEGYAYIFPKRDHVNVGIGYRAGVLPRRRRRGAVRAAARFVDHLRDAA